MSPHTIVLDTLIVGGRRVIPASEAARRTGFSRNYIGLLCRAGELAAVRLTSAGWFVDETSLAQFLEERARKKEEQRKKLRADRRREYASAQLI